MNALTTMPAGAFVAAIARALSQSAAHALGGGNAADESAEFLVLPSDWATRLLNQQNGLSVKQLAENVLQVTSPCQRWRLTLVVEEPQPANGGGE